MYKNTRDLNSQYPERKWGELLFVYDKQAKLEFPLFVRTIDESSTLPSITDRETIVDWGIVGNTKRDKRLLNYLMPSKAEIERVGSRETANMSGV